MNYLKQKANVWVSMAVLAGGLASALILMFVSKVESNAETFISSPGRVEIFKNLKN